jgi:hypothetical protein
MAQNSHGRGGLNPVFTANVSIAVIFMASRWPRARPGSDSACRSAPACTR